MGKRYQDRDWLELMYHGRELTQTEMADRCGVSARTIRTYMKRHGIPRREVRGRNHGLYGEVRDEETRAKISETLEGREFTEEWRERLADAHRGNEVTPEAREKISESLTGRELTEETRRKMSESTRGESNPMWRGGVSHDYVHYGSEWPSIRRRIRERDRVCQECGRGGSERCLDAHHIVPVRAFREADSASIADAHDESNLVLLCRSCHVRAERGDLEFESGIPHPE